MRRLLFAFLVLLSCCGTNSKTYEIGIDPSWYPLELLGQQNNVLAFSIELLVEIGKKEKLNLSILKRTWNNLTEGLQKKEYSAIISSMRPYTFYEKTYSFSDLYIKTGPVVVAPLTSKIKSAQDLENRIVGVVQGSSSTIILQKIPGIILRGFPDITLALHAVRISQVEAGAIPILVAQRFVYDIYSDALKIVSPPLDEEGLRLLTLHNQDAALLERFNRGLAKLKKDGSYESLRNKWGLAPGSAAPSPKTTQAFINHHLITH